jgi:AraC-like DNA-binding protein
MLKTIQICSVIISILTFLVILFKHRRNAYQKILLLTYIFSLTCYSYLIYLIKTGFILDYPNLWNTGSPLNFLHLAAFILFTRSIIKDLKKPKKLDFILMLLPLLSLVAMIPFYLMNVDFKINHIQKMLENKDAIFYATESLIPAYWNFIFQFGFGIIFSAIALYLILKVFKNKNKTHLKSVFIWLICVASLMLFGNLIGLITLIFDSSTIDTHSLDSYIFALYIIIIFLYPFFEPRVLYGALLDVQKKISPTSEKKQELSESELNQYEKQIKLFFDSEVSYLKSNFRQDDLANHLDVSKSKLTQIVITIYNKKFNQLINEKRIEVVLQKFKNHEWLNYSLEGVALEVGFKSRTTFIKAFKEKTSLTPSEYKKLNTPNLL